MPIAKDVILGERVVILEAATESMAERGRLVSLNRAAMT